MRRTALLLFALLLASVLTPACVVVPAYSRGTFTDPAMTASSEALTDRSMRRLHTSREGAAGGDGASAGGGCACGN